MDDGTVNSEYSDESVGEVGDAAILQNLLEFQAVLGAFYQSAITGKLMNTFSFIRLTHPDIILQG
jgi:hypothetical protein